VANVHIAADERDGEVTFLRTVRDGPTDRSYGIHVAGLAGVPDPVVDRSKTVLQRLRDEKAIEARGGGSGGGTKQVVFDVGSGRMTTASADGGSDPDAGNAEDEGSAAGPSEVDPIINEFGDDAAAVLDELSDVDIAETSPIELMSAVQEWRERLDD